MGGFYLYNKSCDVDIEAVKNIFYKMGLREYKEHEAGDSLIYHFKKELIDDYGYASSGNSFLCAAGTIIYKSEDYIKSVNLLLNDYMNNSFNFDEALGAFAILIYHNNRLSLITDGSGIQNIFYLDDFSVISSSFLSCIMSFKTRLKLNKLAALETTATGTLLGRETIFSNINKMLPSDKSIGTIKHLTRKEIKADKCLEGYSSCMDYQIEGLRKYFTSIAPLANKVGADAGITGGHDSRLIMSLALEKFSKISFHSHWRKEKDRELSSAEKVCDAAGVHLVQIPVTPSLEMTEQQMESNINRCMLFYDGQMRMHSFWTEEYNTQEHRKKVLGDMRLGLSGIGGEQYRNEERLILPKKELKSWVKHRLILNYAGYSFINSFENELTEHISSKIRNLLNISGDYITREDYKRYYTELFIPGRLSSRNNAENRLSFFLSPFTEFTISRNAYKIINYLGTSFQFEEDMIKKINPKLAAVTSDHGFDFYKGEPFINKLKTFIRELTPEIVYQNRTDKIMHLKGDDYAQRLKCRFKIVNKSIECFESLCLPINLNKLAFRPDLFPLAVSLGYLILFLKENGCNISADG